MAGKANIGIRFFRPARAASLNRYDELAEAWQAQSGREPDYLGHRELQTRTGLIERRINGTIRNDLDGAGKTRKGPE